MKFSLGKNQIRDTDIVEVWSDDGRLLATINPHQRGLHVVSKHLKGTETPTGLLSQIAPSVLILLDSEMRH